jgi:hypothetical protein
MRVGEAGLVDVEPLAVALTSLETDTAAARFSGLVMSEDISDMSKLKIFIYTQL